MAGDVGGEKRLGAGLLAMFRMLPTLGRGLTVSFILAIVVAGLAPVAFTISAGWLVGAVPPAVDNGFDSAPGRALFVAAVVVAAVYLVQQASGQLLSAVSDLLGRRLSGVLQARAMAATLRPTGVAHLEDRASLDKISLARNVVPGGFEPAAAVSGLGGAVSSRLAVVGSTLVVVRFSWLLALGLFAVWVASQVVLARMVFAMVGGSTGRQADMRRAVYFREVALTPPAAKEVRLFGLPPWLVDRFVTSWTSAMTQARHEVREGRRGMALVVVLRTGALFVGVAVVAVGGARGSIELGTVVILLGAVQGSLATVVGYGDMQAAYGAAAIPAVLSLEKDLTPPSDGPAPTPEMRARPTEAIRFEHVDFSYAEGSTPVFRDFNLDIPAGQRVAVVGVNGAGKTTLVKLLCRLYEPDRGRITVDGVALAEIDPQAWRAQLAVLFQDFVHYQLPLSDNVRFGAVRADADLARLERAVHRAGADAAVSALPDGWDSVLAPGIAKGTDLSGGQWQMVALARALFAVDAGAQVLVLDEPTANLDARAEAEIYDRFLDLTTQTEEGRPPLTTIVISHRFSTVRRADRIIVLEDGRVIEDGSHDDLVAAGGRYAAMFRAQASRFVDDDSDQAAYELPEGPRA